MSVHVEDRLSAFLDGALPAEARAEVEAHLRECAGCAAARRELERLDALARELPLAAPEGYFEVLPRRVRARIESRSRPAPFALPVWAWAAAAALVLAVLAPVTLREAPWPGSHSAPTDSAETPAAPETAASTAPPAAPPRAEVLEERLEAPAESDAALRRLQAPAATTPALPPPGFATEPETPPSRAAEPKATEPSAPRAAREGTSALALAPQAAPERAPRLLGEASAPRAKRTRPETALQDDARADAPSTAAEARDERETLRRRLQVTAQDSDARAVRIIELSLLAWRLEGSPDDLARFREDAAAYLKRPDARQADHVRNLLAAVAAGR